MEDTSISAIKFTKAQYDVLSCYTGLGSDSPGIIAHVLVSKNVTT